MTISVYRPRRIDGYVVFTRMTTTYLRSEPPYLTYRRRSVTYTLDYNGRYKTFYWSGPAQQGVAAKPRTCFYYSNSGWGLWATRNVSCKAARSVYKDATSKISNGIFDRTIPVDGYQCKMRFDGGGTGTCIAPRNRLIRFDVP